MTTLYGTVEAELVMATLYGTAEAELVMTTRLRLN